MSHNSWTYLKPRTLIGCIFRWAGRCQSHSIVEQYEKYGVRIFDLRIKLDKNKIKNVIVPNDGQIFELQETKMNEKRSEFKNKKYE